MKRLALWLLALGACGGEVGTIDLSLATAPGSTLLDGVQRLRVTITNPLTIVETERTENGFDIVLDVEAAGGGGQLIVEGFDANDALIATGASPVFAIAAINARVVIYMAAPLTIGSAPSPLPAARTGVASTRLSYGFAIAGGEDGAGTKTDSLFIYNAFDHSLLAGLAMPAPRAFQSITTGSNDNVMLFGGIGTDNAPTGTVWRFDSTATPNGAYGVFDEHVDLARSAAPVVSLNTETHVITGTPPLDFVFNTVMVRTDVASVGKHGGSVTADSGLIVAVFGGDPVVALENTAFRELALSVDPEDSSAVVGNTIVFASGRGDTELAVIDSTGTASFVDALSTLRRDPAIAATDRFIVIAGGIDVAGVPIATADILSVPDLTLVTTTPCLARSGATAHAMPNGQIAIVGGAPANDVIELFTPPPPL